MQDGDSNSSSHRLPRPRALGGRKGIFLETLRFRALLQPLCSAAAGDHNHSPRAITALKSLAPRSVTTYTVPGVLSRVRLVSPGSPSQSRGAAA